MQTHKIWTCPNQTKQPKQNLDQKRNFSESRNWEKEELGLVVLTSQISHEQAQRWCRNKTQRAGNLWLFVVSYEENKEEPNLENVGKSDKSGERVGSHFPPVYA